MSTHRRTLLCLAAAGAALGLVQPTRILKAARLRSRGDDVSFSGRTIVLWPGAAQGGGGPTGAPQRSAKGARSHISTPALEVFEPAKPNGVVAVIAAGGGYKRIEMESEAYPAARWLAARGVTAFVLGYRLPREGWNDGALAPLQDAQRAIRLVRAYARLHGIDQARVVALGFSAGAHLLGMAAARATFASYPAGDEVDRMPASVDAAALIYPVITLRPPYDHTSTRRMLVGDHPTAKQSADWSVDTWIDARMPALFTVQATDDPISDPANMTILTDAAQRAGIPIEAHRLPSGGHGFGMGVPGTPSADWPSWFDIWLRRHAGI